jgi:hypothetical protein
VLLCGGPSAFAGGDLPPPPDRAAIAAMAQREEPGLPYVAGMPDRHVECDAFARPYLESPGTGAAFAGGTILTECHAAMLVKLAKLYYRPDAFGSDGMPALADRLLDDLTRLYQGINDGPLHCLRYCGSILYLIWSADRGVEFERAVETMALLQVPPSEEEHWLKSWNRAGWVK